MAEWVVVHTATYPQDIYLAQSLLDSEGIATFIRDELTAQVNNFYSTAIGGVKLLVRAEDAERAWGLLVEGGYIKPVAGREGKAAAGKGRRVGGAAAKAARGVEIRDGVVAAGGEAAVEIVRTADREHCPYCGSGEISKTGDANPVAVAMSYLFGLVVPVLKQTYRCWDCDRRWRFGRSSGRS